jgi:hypothetical protein
MLKNRRLSMIDARFCDGSAVLLACVQDVNCKRVSASGARCELGDCHGEQS